MIEPITIKELYELLSEKIKEGYGNARIIVGYDSNYAGTYLYQFDSIKDDWDGVKYLWFPEPP